MKSDQWTIFIINTFIFYIQFVSYMVQTTGFRQSTHIMFTITVYTISPLLCNATSTGDSSKAVGRTIAVTQNALNCTNPNIVGGKGYITCHFDAIEKSVPVFLISLHLNFVYFLHCFITKVWNAYQCLHKIYRKYACHHTKQIFGAILYAIESNIIC